MSEGHGHIWNGEKFKVWGKGNEVQSGEICYLEGGGPG